MLLSSYQTPCCMLKWVPCFRLCHIPRWDPSQELAVTQLSLHFSCVAWVGNPSLKCVEGMFGATAPTTWPDKEARHCRCHHCGSLPKDIPTVCASQGVFAASWSNNLLNWGQALATANGGGSHGGIYQTKTIAQDASILYEIPRRRCGKEGCVCGWWDKGWSNHQFIQTQSLCHCTSWSVKVSCANSEHEITKQGSNFTCTIVSVYKW